MSPQTIPQQVITILLCTAAKALPSAVFAMLVVYCLKNVSITVSPFGIPELIGITATALIHLWKRNTLLSMFTGTLFYMLVIRFLF